MRVECRDVSFRYRRREALSGVSLGLDVGVTGLLGPNGAGKTTLLSLLAAIRRPTSGDILMNGVSVRATDASRNRHSIGYLPQRFDLMRWATVHRNVSYAAWAQGVDRSNCDEAARSALDLVDLGDLAGRRVATLSGGQRQRVGIACAVAHEPQLVLLDEPTAGLDPSQRVQIRSHLAEIAASATVVVSTHIVQDLAHIASQVVVLSDGHVAFSGNITQLQHVGIDTPRAGMSDLESGYEFIRTNRAPPPCRC